MEKTYSSPKESMTDLSQSDKMLPLSPVLGSGQSIKKLISRKRNRNIPKRITQKLEDTFQQHNAYDSQCILEGEECATAQQDTTNQQQEQQSTSNKFGGVLERIKNLEALESQRLDTVKMLSFQTPKLDALVVPQSVIHPVATNIFPPLRHEDRPSEEIQSQRNKLKITLDGFQTVSGKPIAFNLPQMEKSKKLFEDILNPNENLKPPNKKFNYLHHSKVNIRPQDTTACSVDSVLVDNSESSQAVKSIKDIFHNETFNNLELNLKVVESKLALKPCNPQLSPKQDHNTVVNKLTPQNAEELQAKTNIFNDENFSDLNKEGFKFSGFQLLGKQFTYLSRNKVLGKSKAQEVGKKSSAELVWNTKIGKDVFENENFDDLQMRKCKFDGGFQPASVNLQHTKPELGSIFSNLSAKKLNIDEHKLECADYDNREMSCTNISKEKKGFKRRQPPQKKFPSENVDENVDLNDSKCVATFSSSRLVKNIFEGENFDDLMGAIPGTTAKLPRFNVPTMITTSKSFGNIFEGENLDDISLGGFQGFQAARMNVRKPIKKFQSPLIKSSISTASYIEEDMAGFSHTEYQSAASSLRKTEHATKHIEAQLQLITQLRTTRKRKYSEVHHDSLSTTPIQSAPKTKTKKRLGCAFSPTIHISEPTLKRARLLFEDLEPTHCYTSTPIRQPQSDQLIPNNTKSPLNSIKLTSPLTLTKSKNVYKPLQCDLTPIRKFKSTKQPVERISLEEPSVRDVRLWLDNLTRERQELEERLRIVDKRQTILFNQKTILEYSKKGKTRVSVGVLYKAKTGPRKTLLDFLGNLGQLKHGKASSLDEISPQNAHLVHFTVCDRECHLVTEDGAVVVPNSDNRVGISEIEFSFKTLESIDVQLLPKSWLQNHFKWIVWKLASYERMCPDQLPGCLNVENVMQQLKFRYDIEIDKAQRPILRKILERDDCSQRRLILCVSKIVNLNASYELELTDGWYSVRTLVDRPLCEQITKGKIAIGQKLVVYGADLKNCEGCHPLEASRHVHLQINYNCVRRSLWWCKLGAQKHSGPFLVPLASVNPEGGKVGCIRCFIARVYPVRYMEKCGSSNVWRNQKAQERHRQAAKSYKDLKAVDDPRTLYDILQNSADPESLQEMLSEAQKSALYNYSLNSSREGSSSNVISLLIIKIADAYKAGDDHVYEFRVWRPAETHFDELKEGTVVTIFNAACSSKWGLSAGRSTQFKRESRHHNGFEKFRRKVTPIAELPTFWKEPRWSDEFDTVGFVVKKVYEGVVQEIWLADSDQSLLRIVINHSPKNVLVLDTVSEGQVISVCNLTFKQSMYSHCQAIGDLSVIIARYSQYCHLQEALEEIEKKFERINKSSFLQDCLRKVQAASHKPMTDEMECSQITVTDIALLECMEKLS